MREHLSQLGRFLKEDLRHTAMGCAIGMVAAIALGAVAGALAPEVVTQVMEAFMEMVLEAGVVDEAGNLSPFALLLNNWRAMLVTICYGFLPFIYLPVLTLVSNGFLIGLMAAYYQISGLPLSLYLAALLPHGIFELAALVLAAACGMYLCRNIGRLVTNSPKKIPAVELLTDLLRVLVMVIAPLTAAAAFIESYITPVIASFFM